MSMFGGIDAAASGLTDGVFMFFTTGLGVGLGAFSVAGVSVFFLIGEGRPVNCKR